MAEQFEGVQWVLGNHTDELTPWVPLITRHLALRELQRHAHQQQLVTNVCQQDIGCGIHGADEGSKDKVRERAYAAIQNASVEVTLQHGELIEQAVGPSLTKRLSILLPRYWVLPCCLWDIGSQGLPVKFIGHDKSLGRYHTCVCLLCTRF